ncbi:hypothetical protein QYM36_002828 [Artemia franciscana]|uniref:Uncharacterized protein n=1 Tax=Artemia franciscana TaxID=6661 RepID=A0AA88IKD3_ARTSF|nr:hypothetical protein QYM36_002828 [Artemia franciscana]
MPKRTALSEEELQRLIEDDNDEDLSSDLDGDPKDKDWVPDKDGSRLDSDGETPNQESFIEADISAPDPTFPEATATELDVVDDQASVERRNTKEHPKRKKGCRCKLERKTINQDAQKAIFESFWLLGKELVLHGVTETVRFEVCDKEVSWYVYNSDFSVIKVNKLQRRMTPNKNSLELVSAYKGPIPLPPAKYKDLMDLCHTLVIPRTFHKYYAAVPSLESTRDALDESGVKEEDPEDL